MAYIICIDPGHGGSDPGAIGNGLKEKNLSLSIAAKLFALLQNNTGIAPVLTRSTDATMSIDHRWQKANGAGADLFISIHMNSAGGTAGDGMEVYPKCPKESYHAESMRFARLLVEQMRPIQNMRGTDQSGIRFCYNASGKRVFAEYKDGNPHGYTTYYGVVRNTKCPAVLTEVAFINNPNDIHAFSSEAQHQDVASRYYAAICAYFGISAGTDKPPDLTPPNSSSSSKLYKVQCGAFSKKANAENLSKQLKTYGFPNFILHESGLYMVQVGAYSIKANAEEQALKLRKSGFESIIKEY